MKNFFEENNSSLEIINWDGLYSKNVVCSKIRFDKNMDTVFDLSYFLIDFQACINSLYELISEVQYETDIPLLEPLLVDRKNRQFELEQFELLESKIKNNRPKWQKEVEERVESLLLDTHKAAANTHKAIASTPTVIPERLKQTTNRKFNLKYRMNLQLRGFSQGSLVLDVANSVLVSVITEFIKELLVKQTENVKIVNINIENSYIIIDGFVLKVIPKNSHVEKAICIKGGKNILDVEKCVHDIVEASHPDENIEESVKRLLRELKGNGIIREVPMYDSRGIKTVVKDIERLSGNFIDVRF